MSKLVFLFSALAALLITAEIAEAAAFCTGTAADIAARQACIDNALIAKQDYERDCANKKQACDDADRIAVAVGDQAAINTARQAGADAVIVARNVYNEKVRIAKANCDNAEAIVQAACSTSG